jgi:hypothetical protein
MQESNIIRVCIPYVLIIHALACEQLLGSNV